MDQLKIIDVFSEEILNQLPEEAVQKLADLYDNNSITEENVNAILEEYGVNINEIVKREVEKED